MTRFEKWKETDVKEVAAEICIDISNAPEGCESCPYMARCDMGHNGVLDYLMEEV